MVDATLDFENKSTFNIFNKKHIFFIKVFNILIILYPPNLILASMEFVAEDSSIY